MSTAADGQVQPGWEPATGWSHVAVGCWPLKSGLAGVEGGSPGRQRKNEREEMETVGMHNSQFEFHCKRERRRGADSGGRSHGKDFKAGGGVCVGESVGEYVRGCMSV